MIAGTRWPMRRRLRCKRVLGGGMDDASGIYRLIVRGETTWNRYASYVL